MEGCRKGMSTGWKGVGKGSVADGRVSERDEYGMEGCRNGMSARIGGMIGKSEGDYEGWGGGGAVVSGLKEMSERMRERVSWEGDE